MSMSPSHTVTDLRIGYPSFCFLRQSLYIIMDNKTKTREECITLIENYYCQRLTDLVDMKMFDDAHAIYEEFAVDVDNPVEWFFIADVEDDGTETLSIDDQTNK